MTKMTKRTYPILLTSLFLASFFLSLNSPPGAGSAFAADNIFTDKIGIGTTAPAGLLHIGVGATAPSALVVSSTTGNVGIGLTNPAYKFQVNGGFTEIGVFNTTDIPPSNSNGGVIFSWNRSQGGAEVNLYNAYDNAATSFQFSQKTGAATYSDLVTIKGTGYVGIGTTAPQSILNINGTLGSLAGGLSFGDGDTGFFEDSDDRLRVSTGGTVKWEWLSGNYLSASGGGAFLLQTGTSATVPFVAVSDDTDTGVGLGAANELSLIAGGTEVIRLKAGNVGIGTTGPSGKFHVAGSSENSIYFDHTAALAADTGPIILLRAIPDGGTTPVNVAGIYGKRENANSGDYSGYLAFRTELSGGTLTEKVRITSTGYVGIGSTIPAYKLDVAGDIRATGTIYGASGTQVPIGTGTANYVPKWSASGTLGNSVMYDNGTNVGIGTTNPGYLLEVADANLKLGYLYLSGSQYNPQLGSGSSGGSFAIVSGGTYEGGIIKAYGGLHATLPGIITFSVGTQSGASPEKVRINSEGNVGIGTTTPDSLLHVKATASGADAYIKSETTGAGDAEAGFVTKNANGSWATGYMYNTRDDWELQRLSGSGDVLFPTGNVGIGTTVPNTKLGVSGTIGTQDSYTSAISIGTFGNATAQGGVQRAFSAQGSQTFAANNDWIYGFQSNQSITNGGGYTGLSNASFYASATAGSGTVANNYGLYIETPTRGTTNYSIYSAGGTNYFGGNVGIGTTGPGSQLEVGGTGHLNLNGSDSRLKLNGTTILDSGFTLTNIQTFRQTNASNSSYFLGNVGIGTTGPGAMLDISTTSNNTANLYLSERTTTGGEQGGLIWRGYYNGTSNFFESVGIKRINIEDNNSTSNMQRLGFFVRNPVVDGALVERMSIRENGKVGIGTAAPDYNLDVMSTAAEYPTLRIKSLNTGGYAPQIRLSTYGYSGSPAAYFDILRIETGYTGAGGSYTNFLTKNQPESSEVSLLFLNHNTGRVGIGTVSPTAKLTLNTGTILVGTDGSSGDTSLYLRGGASGDKATITLNHYGSADYAISAGAIPGKLSLTKTSGSADGIIIDSSGNVGIGTTSPGARLEVAGTGGLTELRVTTLDTSLYNNPTLTLYSNYPNDRNWGWRTALYELGDIGLFQSASAGASPFAGTDRLHIKANGNVGIGTTAPGAKLNIHGSDQEIRLSADSIGTQAKLYAAGGDGILELYQGYVPSQLKVKITSYGDSYFNQPGNVGIGITTPGAKLDVVGSVRISTKGFQTGSTVKTAGTSTKRIGYTGMGSSLNVTLLTASADGGYVISGFLTCRRDSSNGGIYPFIAGYNYNTGYGVTVGSPIAGSTGTAPVVAWVSNVLQLQLSDYHYCGVDATLTIYQEPTTLSFGDILGG